MALAFRDCCNQYSYFLLESTPSFVSEFETYYIQTLQGINFCAVYTNLPTLNYSPPIYTLSEMTQQSSCGECIISFPCPSSEVILVNEFSSGSVAQGTDCQIVTIPPIFVECLSTNPTTFNGEDGRVQLVVSGGVAPYRFLIAGTESFLQGTPAGDNLYTLYDGVSAGTYSITVQDSNLDFSTTANCVLENPSQALVIEPIVTPASRFGASDGAVEFVLTDGIPPFSVSLNSEDVGLLIENLSSGIYYFEVSDQISSQIIVVEVTQPDPIVYPPGLCMTFELCGTLFNLNFIRLPIYENLKPRYKCTNPTKIGLKQLYIRWGLGGGFVPDSWVTTVEEVQPDDIQFEEFPGDCNFSDPRFAVIGPFFNNEQPTGTWFGGLGFMLGKFPVVTPGGCPPTASVKEPIEGYCAGPPPVLAEVFVEGLGGSGGPFRFFYSSNGVNYIESPTNILNLTNGTYSLKVMDSDGIESLPINFVVPIINYQYSLNNIGVCTFLEPETVGLTGVLDRPILAGESRGIDATVSYYFDFSNIPDGLIFTGRWNIRFATTVYSAGEGFTNPLTNQETLFELIEAYQYEDGVRTDIKNNFAIQGNPFNSITAIDYAGSNVLYTPNYGAFLKQAYTDNCTASTVNPSRTSPNAWFDCDNLSGPASLIEGDERGAIFDNNASIQHQVNMTFTQNTKLHFKIRVKQENFMPTYIPITLRETDASTLEPAYHTPAGLTILNQPNIDLETLGSRTTFSVNMAIFNRVVTQPPPSIKCFKFDNNSGIGSVPSSLNPNLKVTAFNFSLETNKTASGFGGEVSNYNGFVFRNNNCGTRPPWAQ